MVEEKERRDRVWEGSAHLAFGSIADPVGLLFEEEVSPRRLKNMDLYCVAEIRRPKNGGMEIKFFDRLKALQCMESFDAQQNDPVGFYEALQAGAGRFCAQDGEAE